MLLRKLLSDCRWPSRKEENDIVQQELQLPPRRKSLVLHSISETTLNSAISSSARDTSERSSLDTDSQIGASNSQKIEKRQRAVPVLFSTNCGLYLRVPKKTLSSWNVLSNGSESASEYNISFCDLERWSTNRAHTISLEDTFTIAHSSHQEHEELQSTSLELRVPSLRNCYGQKQPIKRSLRLYNAFSRFETRY